MLYVFSAFYQDIFIMHMLIDRGGMKMTNQEVAVLLERIQQHKSVLFLGQKYLNYDPSINYLQMLQEELRIKSRRTLPFSGIVEEALDETGDAKAIDEIKNAIDIVSGKIDRISWLRHILKMRWNTICTSAVDGLIYKNHSTTRIYNPETEKFQKRFTDVTYSTLLEVYGHCEGEIPFSQKARYKHDTSLYTEIVRFIIEQFGVVIIEGWDHTDWLGFEELLDRRFDLQYESVFIFGITEQALLDGVDSKKEKEVLEDNLNNGFIRVIEKSFASVLQDYGYFDHLDEQQEQLEVGNSYSVTIPGKNEKDSSISITVPKKELQKLSNVTLMHDELTLYEKVNEDELEELFVQYLLQETPPNWRLCSSSFPFYFERDLDDELLEMVKSELKRSSDKRRYIVLEGFSNSGKTAMLTHLALRLRKERLPHPAPVFYISDTPENTSWMNTLREYIKNNILTHEIINHKMMNHVIIICDMNLPDYSELHNFFQDCNALIIGSSYIKRNNMQGRLQLSSDLSSNEEKALKALLKRINPYWPSMLDKYAGNQKKKPYLFDILFRLARFSNSEEWIRFRSQLKSGLRQEADYTEREAGAAFIKYVENVECYGIAAETQIYVEEHKQEMNNVQLDYIKQIQLLNEFLAVAGQFGVSLPLSLLLKIIKRTAEDCNPAFITNVLNWDTMTICQQDPQYSDTYVGFRHPSEAFNYLTLKHKDEKTRKSNDIECLTALIHACEWNSEYSNESKIMCQLIRYFGPNSQGRPFESVDTSKEYLEHWHDIITQLSPDKSGAIKENPEVMLIYSHFLRELTVEQRKKQDEEHCEKLEALEEELIIARELMSEYTKEQQEGSRYVSHRYAQLSRLEGEICANLNYFMFDCSDEEFDDYFDDFKAHYHQALQYHYKDSHSKTTSNLLLHIWLCAVEHFKERFHADKDTAPKPIQDHYADLMAESLNRINMLFDINGGEKNFTSVLSKVRIVFEYFQSDRFKEIKKALEARRNDSIIYLHLMKPFVENYTSGSLRDDALKNSVMVFLSEIPDKDISERHLKDYKQKAKEAARQMLDWCDDMEIYPQLAKKYKSHRCIYLYLKAKWICYTDNLLLELKQKPMLTREQWREIKNICDDYISCFQYNSDPEIKPAVLMLYGMYNWCFADKFDYKVEVLDIFNYCSSSLRNQESIYTRFYFCNDKGKPYRFRASIDLEPGQTTASLSHTDREYDNSILPAARHSLYVSERITNRLFPDRKHRRLAGDECPVVHVCFNGKGAQIELASGGDDDAT